MQEKIASLEKVISLNQGQIALLRRELAVENLLQKVSSRAVTMRSSSELSETSALLFQHLEELQIYPIRCGVGIFDDANEAIELWLTTTSGHDEELRVLDYYSLHVHPVYENIIPARKNKEPYALTVLKGQQVRQFYEIMSTYLSPSKDTVYNEEEYFYSFLFPHGTLYLITLASLSVEECNILIRFAEVFGLIYLRFLDLQTAELQTLKARQQSALHGIRAEIASMHTADDLNHITPMLWKVLKGLDVPFIRCGLFIINKDQQTIQAYLSTPEGKTLAVLNLGFDETVTIRKMVDHWKDRNIYREQWDRFEFQQWVHSMLQKGQIEGPEEFSGTDASFDILHLQFVPFAEGMLYVGSRESLIDEHLELTHSLAESFSMAYARYLDFKALEAAKNNMERAFKELKATQAQLIQSEKMASLGELTAGIAHEIQNPLNFVNNFSEVSAELLKELMEEVQKGDWAEVKALAEDLTKNLEKIVHHGKRADGIVKGMLQHSRSSEGKKEATDLNKLADEYLRLAYHGLRAKDKSFNADLETDFDAAVGWAQVIPQDIGRALLNLVTNAFHAVTEKKRQAPADYQPKVTVRTRKTAKGLEIAVIDNGNGVPEHIQEKIFQPFFTTKPTGQGTGLGLSMSYDIVTKGHGGTLSVESNEGKGTAFTINLPGT